MSLPTLIRPRLLAAVLGLVGIVTLLTGCAKPQATITLLSNSRSSIVDAQPPCTMLADKKCNPEASKEPTIKARGGSQILVDVPRALSDAGWIVSAYTSDGATNTPLPSSGGFSTAAIRGDHTVRVNVPAATTGTYYLQVTALAPSNQLTNWLCLVQLTQ